jgi:hypothetical protein
MTLHYCTENKPSLFFCQPDPITGIAKPTPLVELRYFGLVSQVVLESMHTLFELVCKKFLEDIILGRYLNNMIRRGVRNADGQPVTYRSVLDSRLKLCQKLCPDEFQRKVSTTVWIKSWKATELRQFWVYLAYPLLEDLLTHHPVASQEEKNILELVR